MSKGTEKPRMDFQQFLQAVGGELQEILWNDRACEWAGAEIDALERDFHRASAALCRLRSSVEHAQSRLAENERRARRLEAQVELYWHLADQANAWQYALELDGLRPSLHEDRARLRRRRQAYQAQLDRVQRLGQRLETPGRVLSNEY